MRYKDFILVNFNYRLGIHGFLSLGTADVPGNAGMKDQVALLRWAQENIGYFGGNPNNVTISGYSAGGSAVDLLMLSKAAEGLFHKVTPESGASIAKNDTILRYVDYFSDVFFVQGALWVVKLHVEAGHDQVYLYEYSFVDEDTPVVPYTNERGAMHVAQTVALGDGQNLTVTNEDLMSEIWHNFIITDKPVPEGSSLPAWPAVSVGNSPYMSLGQKLELGNAIEPERFNSWQKIYQKYYREPIQTPYPLPKTHTKL